MVTNREFDVARFKKISKHGSKAALVSYSRGSSTMRAPGMRPQPNGKSDEAIPQADLC
jgi:hypothetical protein